MTRRQETTLAVIVAAVALTMALLGASRSGADEDEEKPIVSRAARVSRDAAGNVVVAIQPAAQKAMGLATMKLDAVVRPVEVEAYGFILDPAPLSKLNSDLVSARAALDASRAQYLRSRRLYREQKNVSLRDLQGAQASYLADQSRLDALEQRLRDEWGAEIAQMEPAYRSQLISALIDRRQALARATVPAGKVLDRLPASAEVVVLGHERRPLSARAVYYAPQIDRNMQGQSFLLRLNADRFLLLPGAAISAALPVSSAREHGVMVPRSSVVRHAGKDWVYQALSADSFTRREIRPAQILPDGYFVIDNLRPGARVVVTGAQSLLSEELKQQIQPSD